MIPNLYIHYIAIVIFSISRPILYACVTNYCTKVFGFKNFGATYGLIVLIAGVVNLSQFLFSFIAIKVLNSFLVVNIIMLIISFSAILFPIYLQKFVDKDHVLG